MVRDRYSEDYNLYYPLVFSAVYTKVDNIDDTQDICQEVFMAFFEKYEGIENKRKWLYGALRFSVINYYRKKRGTGVDIDDVFSDVALTFVNGFRDTRILIAEAIESIQAVNDDVDRTLFDLVAVHNFSYSDTARQLGLTKRKVEYRYRRIVDQILDYLGKKGINNIGELL